MEKISYEDFKEEWLKDILANNPECINGIILNSDDDAVITRCITDIFDGNHPEAAKKLYKAALGLIENISQQQMKTLCTENSFSMET